MRAVSPIIYARAFRKALKEKGVSEDGLVQNLCRIVKERSTPRQGNKIVRKVSEEIVRHNGGRLVMVETARQLADAAFKKIKNTFLRADYVEQRERPELIAGMRIVIDGEKEFDGSLKRKFDILFGQKI